MESQVSSSDTDPFLQAFSSIDCPIIIAKLLVHLIPVSLSTLRYTLTILYLRWQCANDHCDTLALVLFLLFIDPNDRFGFANIGNKSL
jgi:hypothetical protein